MFLTTRRKHAFVAKGRSTPVLAVIAPTRELARRRMDTLIFGPDIARRRQFVNDYLFYRTAGCTSLFSYHKAKENQGA